MSDIAGASRQQRNNPQHLHNYHSKYKLFKENEKQWFACVIDELKEAGVISDKMLALVGRGLMLITFSAVVYAYYLDFHSSTSIFIYSIIAGFLFIRGWIKPARRLFILLFYLVSLIASLMLYDVEALFLLLITIVLSGVLYLLTPLVTLSGEAIAVQPEIQAFIKQLKLDRFPEKITSQYDQWTIRSLLLKPKHQSKAPNKEFFSNETSAAPLTYLVAS